MQPLPIDAVLPALLATLRERTAAVLQAPPGAGFRSSTTTSSYGVNPSRTRWYAADSPACPAPITTTFTLVATFRTA